jgi:hypothetical protein
MLIGTAALHFVPRVIYESFLIFSALRTLNGCTFRQCASSVVSSIFTASISTSDFCRRKQTTLVLAARAQALCSSGIGISRKTLGRKDSWSGGRPGNGEGRGGRAGLCQAFGRRRSDLPSGACRPQGGTAPAGGAGTGAEPAAISKIGRGLVAAAETS